MRKTSADNTAVVERLGIEHASSIRDIATLCGLSDWSVDDYANEASRPDAILLGPICGGRLLGFISGRIVPSMTAGLFDVEIYNIGIRPENRREGLGRKLMQNFIVIAASRCIHTVWLEVRAGNDAAIAFYRSHGFTDSGRRRNFYTNPADDAVLMTLRLFTA